mmetsp:Transcript_7252/g.17683  ORF Transcript_7252/g.17683 Transcript_7252/m.17683 type:complete len:410 (-) Transcript_7252:120-1349(-)
MQLKKMTSLANIVPPGVVTGDNLLKLLKHARENSYALPAVNCTSSSTVNAVLEAAQNAKAPVIVQVTHGDANYIAGDGVEDPNKAVAGAVALAMHVRSVAKYYNIPVVLHSDHCSKKFLSWFDGMLKADEEFFAMHGEPLFSSHMIDLSAEPDDENIMTCVEYFKRMAPMKIWLEMEIGITGGVEDGVDNEDVDPEKLYTTPQQVWSVYEALSKVGPMFSVAAAFGNVHGVYKPGNVKLSPERLGHHQAYVKEMLQSDLEKPIYLVMHGGSGSTDDEIKLAVNNGVIKMNINTDTQWAYWDGVRKFESEKRAYLQGQIGNPDGTDKANKNFYAARVWLRKAEESMCKRVMISMDKLFTTGTYKVTEDEPAYTQIGSISSKTEPSPVVLVVIGAILGSAATILMKAAFKK